MPEDGPDRRELGYYFELAQVSLEMVLPLIAGIFIDRYFDWPGWAAITGAVLGFAVGLFQLVMIVRRRDRDRRSRP
jgi:hypothetical protein